MLAAGIAGALAGYGLEYWTQVIAYPLNIGGRPYLSWVSFIPPAFETTILFARVHGRPLDAGAERAAAAVSPGVQRAAVRRASQDKFFLAIEASDPKFDLDQTRAFLSGLNAREVVAVDE